MKRTYKKHKVLNKITVVPHLNTKLKYNKEKGGFKVWLRVIFNKQNSSLTPKIKLYFSSESDFNSFLQTDSPKQQSLLKEIDEIRISISEFLQDNSGEEIKYSDWSKIYFTTRKAAESIDLINITSFVDADLETEVINGKIKYYQKKGFEYVKHESVSYQDSINQVTFFFTNNP